VLKGRSGTYPLKVVPAQVILIGMDLYASPATAVRFGTAAV